MQASVSAIVEKQRDFFGTHRSKDVDFRIEQLRRLKAGILAYEDKITEALYGDLRKSKMGTLCCLWEQTDILVVFELTIALHKACKLNTLLVNC